MLISEIYGKEIITNAGKRIGNVEDIMLDFEKGGVYSLLLKPIDTLYKGDDRREGSAELAKNSVAYARVKKVSDTTIIVGL